MLSYTPIWSRRITAGGPPEDCYFAVYCPDHPFAWKSGYVYEHRLVLEQKLGRLLEAHEVAHHKNERKQDNHPENLEVATRPDHTAEHHAPPREVLLTCGNCGVSFTRAWNQRPEVKGNRSGDVFCSRPCRAVKYPPPSQQGKKWKQRSPR